MQRAPMEEIGAILGVSKATIHRDVKDLFVSDETITPAKTDRNPKGAGRPKGTSKPLSLAAWIEANIILPDTGVSLG